ncbi:class I SAM-dependent methyltransferase [Hoeflea sp.]|uniref:class I SAM-dependent methyltransferase n=1 Tax=Hoeflea sp. TaxID=1940281 RepID=UPI0019B65C76|nr:class I SAM-dependent methyltransferase [Hoeflea sp.]MBC7284518.1 class I SAM-dependent methyltransferase [Hoeflea sp.]
MENLDAVADKYLADPSVEIENDLIMNWYPKRIGDRVGHIGALLELGLGHGYTVPYFARMTDHHEVVEGSQRVIDHFRSKNPGYKGRLVQDYFETYTPDRRFDVIVMGFVLEHVEDPRAVLERYRSFLAPGGRVCVAVPNAKSLNRRLGLEMGMIDNIYDLNATDHQLGHKRNYCRDTLRADVEAAGYRTTLEEGIYLKPLPLGVLKTLDDMEANLQAMLKVGVDFPDLCVALLFELEADGG